MPVSSMNLSFICFFPQIIVLTAVKSESGSFMNKKFVAKVALNQHFQFLNL